MNKINVISIFIAFFLIACSISHKLNSKNTIISPMKKVGGIINVFKKFPIKWQFSCQFSDFEKHRVRNSFLYWESVSEKQMFEEIDGCTNTSKFNIIVIKQVDFYYYVDGKIRPTTFATGESNIDNSSKDIVGGTIVLYIPWKNNGFLHEKSNIIRHEIGHVLGYSHSMKKSCLMYKNISLLKYKSNKYNYTNKFKNLCLEELINFEKYYGDK